LLSYADVRFSSYTDFLSYSVEGNGIKLNFIGVDGGMQLGSLFDIRQLADFLDRISAILKTPVKGVGHSACTAYPEGSALREICEGIPEGDPNGDVMRACLIRLYEGGDIGYANPGFEDYGVAAHAFCIAYGSANPDKTIPRSP